ncbi:MAG: cupin domain-containing protein, partial [Acidobacteria bacterium]|nr:cupin domain-containing protein [Acidobacteriota bacterium]
MTLQKSLLATVYLLLPAVGVMAQSPAAGTGAEPSSPMPPGMLSADAEDPSDAARPSGSDLVFVDDEAGKVWNIFGLKIVGKIFSRDTGGQYAVIQSNVPPGGGPPRHVHEHEDEMFYVLHGEFDFFSGESTVRASSGALVVLPRGLPHGFRNVGEEPGVLINTITPGGFEDFFEAIDQL